MPLNGTDHGIDRRSLIRGASLAGLAATLATRAGAAAGTTAGSFPVPEGFIRFPIWPGKAPGGEKVTVTPFEGLRKPDGPHDDTYWEHVVSPSLTMLRPARPNGGAVLLIPGGGYRRVAIGLEGYMIARRLAAAGYVCFTLLYRLPADGWTAGPEAPLQDAQRALRMVKSFVVREHFDAQRVAVMGFSAGGHLAAWLSSRAPVETYKPIDAVDQQPLTLGAAALMYPVISMDAPFSHAGSREQLIGADAPPEMRKKYSMEEDISPSTPPTFLVNALDDKTVPYMNTVTMLNALHAKAIPAECHLLESGGHGFGIGAAEAATAAWPDLFLAFLKRHGV